ncbi:hypothetical protein GQ607_012808 [Colletotrichum asianum]|uniref:Uncharacterized protein n=1 Tax=Colletotrichum asianum TaxID=702518 RepID=A0A8H3W546_9PEZI|nr:hypothetical protein GQ607_012808 [Colletotrichum asianum]
MFHWHWHKSGRWRSSRRRSPSVAIQNRHGPEFEATESELGPRVPLSAREEFNQIMPTLINDIRYLKDSPEYEGRDDAICALQLVMKKSSVGWQPTLVIRCSTQQLRSYLEAELPNISEVLSSLSFGPPAFAAVDLAGGQHIRQLATNSENKEVDTVLASIVSIGDRSYPNGGVWKMTVGGTVLVDGRTFGLTVGHYRVIPSVAQEELRKDSRPYSRPSESPKYFHGFIRSENFPSKSDIDKDSDWALVVPFRLGPVANRLTIQSPNSDGAEVDSWIIDEIMDEGQFTNFVPTFSPNSRVRGLVVTHSGLCPALVDWGTSVVLLGGLWQNVYEVHLHEPLPLGSSRSWVIVNNQLLGTIIATQEGRMCAFALAVKRTFDSIRIHMNAVDVELPSEVETYISQIYRLPSSRRSRSTDFKLDLLQAMKRSGLNFRAPLGPSTGVNHGLGWLGVQRNEVLGLNPAAAYSVANGTIMARAYETLIGLKIDTMRALIRVGHIFPVHEMFRDGLRKWVAGHKVSHLRVTRAIAVRVILDECLGTEAGENILALILTLNVLLQDVAKFKSLQSGENGTQQSVIWFRRLFTTILDILIMPPTQIPSKPQVETFVLYCLVGFKEVPQLSLNRWQGSSGLAETISDLLEISTTTSRGITQEDLLPVEDFARMILELSDVAHSKGQKVLVCCGDPWAVCANSLAPLLGLTVHTRSYHGDGTFQTENALNSDSSVVIYRNLDITILEVIV